MEVIARLLIGRESENPEKRNVIWNMIGSFLYAFASMVLTIAVVQIVGEDAGGIFTFAFTTFGQHMFMAAYFGIRPFQITDTGNRYSFGEYLGLRLLTCVGALGVGLLYVFWNTYTFTKAATVFLMVAYKVIDALADTYEAEFQRQGKLYLTGKSNAFRTLLSIFVFLSVLAVTKALVFSCVWAVLAQAFGFFLFDAWLLPRLPGVDWSVRKGKKWALLKDNTLLFVSVILDFYVFSASKYAVEACMQDKDMAVYGAIFMPTSVINLAAGFVIRPYLTRLSIGWERGERKKFTHTILKLAAVITGLALLAVLGAWFLGIPVLSRLYPKLRHALLECRPALLLIILGGAFNAYMNLFYYSLVIMKQQRLIFAGYGLVAAFALLSANRFVKRGGILGGALVYLALMAALAAVFGLLVFVLVQKKKRKECV
ncbi:MAG: lipopolysaccharide biosynthesis protein [Lachnospiraceae bacterium]|jgi:O-antigen/teichoic acid export membrane protein|nr:lipopolysaccharide biosynthesis protein [Lachnospiraceae bacterium]